MKTQIIALEAHDDLISVRDRMSWAKSPRILLVWPKREKVALRAADLRILQQHASNLGAELGVITRRGDVRRDAQQFGIPVFPSATVAQRQKWPERRPTGYPDPQRSRRQRAELQALREAIKPSQPSWASRPAARIGFFTVGVLAVLMIAGAFVPHAEIKVSPVARILDLTLPVTASKAVAAVSLAGNLPVQQLIFTVKGTQSARVGTQTSIPDQRARGIARFTNLSQSDLTIPAGTIVYSLAPVAVQFSTVNDTHLPGNVNAVVEVPIVAVSGGAEANLPANAIRAIQGNLNLSAAVSNPNPTTGGTDRVTAAPSDADRQRLHDVLIEQLKHQARAQVADSLGEKDLALVGTLQLVRILEETYDPPAGKPGNLLTLTMRAEFAEEYVRAEDLSQLTNATLNGSTPLGYLPVAESTVSEIVATPSMDSDGVSHFKLHVGRRLVQDIDLNRAAAIVRGKSLAQATDLLQASIGLAKVPEIEIFPSGWPWMPLIPFRISVSSVE